MRIILFCLSIALLFSCTQNPKLKAASTGLKPATVTEEAVKVADVPDTNAFGIKINLADVFILKKVDAVEGKTSYYPSQYLKYDNDNGYLMLRPVFTQKNGKVAYMSFILDHKTGCSENDKLFVLFEDSTRIQLTSWQDFNCDGVAYFDLYGNILNKLQKPVKALKFVNGRNYGSVTQELTGAEKNYFINLKQAVDQQKVFEKTDS